MSRAQRVVVLGGGANEEHEVSLASAAAVREALREGGYAVVGLTIERDGSWTAQDDTGIGLGDAITLMRRSDAVFPALHGVDAEDGTMAGFLRLIGVPFVGSGVRAGALAMDKWAAKLIAERLGVRTARSVLAGKTDAENAALVAAAGLRAPVIVKPVASGSSYGATRAEHLEVPELGLAVAGARRFDERVLIEEFVVAREIDVAVLRRADGRLHIAPPLEIGKHAERIFDTALKYDATPEFIVPATLSGEQRERLREAAGAIYEGLGCGGVARVDFFVTEHEIVFNEINTMPGMTAHSQVPRMFAADGVSFAELVHELVRAAHEAHRTRGADAENTAR